MEIACCDAVGFGKTAPGKDFPTIYISGKVGTVSGIYRSIDEGVSWERLNDDAHPFGARANGGFVNGDMTVYGRVYMSTAGRGIAYGEIDAPAANVHQNKFKQNARIQIKDLGAFDRVFDLRGR